MSSKNTAKKSNKSAKPAALKLPKVPRVIKNGVARPKAGGTTARVWEIADAITEKTGERASRAAVLAAADKAKLKPGMAKSQYYSWSVHNGFAGANVKPAKKLTAPKVATPKPPTSLGRAKLKTPGKVVKLPKPPSVKPASPVPAATPTETSATS